MLFDFIVLTKDNGITLKCIENVNSPDNLTKANKRVCLKREKLDKKVLI